MYTHSRLLLQHLGFLWEIHMSNTSYTHPQTKALADSYFQSTTLICPLCSALVKIQETPESNATILLFQCTRCHTYGTFVASHSNQSQWTNEMKANLKLAIEGSQIPRCPIDNSVLDVQKIPYLGGASIMVRCPRCGQFTSW